MTNAYLLNYPAPLGVPTTPLSKRQLEDPEVELQRASKVLHARAQTVASVQEIGAVVLAIAGMTCAVFDIGESQIAITGFLWFLISTFCLARLAQSFTEEAALIQEVFDCRLFNLDWNDTLHSSSAVSRDRVLHLAGKLNKDSRDEKAIQNGWYDPTDGLHYPHDVLISQEQNLCWDIRLRQRFKLVLGILGGGWTLLGFAVALSGASVAQTLLVIFVPAAAAYDLGRERWRVQRTVATERRRAAGVVAAALTTATSGPLTPERRSELTQLAHQVQDTLYRTRAEFGRVPGILYNSRRDQDEAEFANMAETHRTNLTAGTG